MVRNALPSGTLAAASGQLRRNALPGKPGATGSRGAAGTPIRYESPVNDIPDLQAGQAPGPDGNSGSSGWGWDSTTNKPVTDLTAGSTNMFTVTALQPNTEQTDATITLSWNPCDFSYEGNGDGSASCALAANTPAEACTYTDSVHSAKGESFKFKANHDDPDAVTGVTVTTSSRRQR